MRARGGACTSGVTAVDGKVLASGTVAAGATGSAAALAAGLAYAYQPVNPAVQSAEEVAQFRALVSTLPKPVVAFCRTGTRCGKLFQAAQLA